MHWDKAIPVGHGADQLLLVPLASDAALFAHSSHTGTRYLVITRTPAGALDGKILELLLRRTTATLDTTALFTSLYHTYQSGNWAVPVLGDGLVLLYSADYQYLTGRRFRDGHFLASTARLAFQRRSNGSPMVNAANRGTAENGGATTNFTEMPDQTCTDWYDGNTGVFITTTGDCSGGGSDGGYVPPYTGPAAPGPGGYYPNPGGGGSPSSTNVVLNVSLAPCQTAILTGLQGLNNGMLSYIVNKFSGTTPGYNWRLYNGSLPSGINGQTTPYDRTYNVVSTTFDASKFQNGTDLSVARTMLHEAIHAYLVTYFANNPAYASASYPDLVTAYATNASNNPNNPQHAVMASNSWLNDLAWALEQYGISKGYTLPSQYYSDMAWGGLTTTPAFQALPQNDKNRISNLLSVEQSGNDLSGNPQTQNGSKSGCK